MIEEEAFAAMIEEIKAQGYDEETAGRFAVLIGDMPIVEDGKVVVMSGGKVLAKVVLRKFVR